jgi:hypothetical protein
MDQQNNLKQLQDLVTNAGEILVITKEQPSIDGLAACLSIFHAFSGQRTLQGKQKRVTVAVAGRQGSQYSLMPGADKIVSELGLRDLVIGINGYTENSIESVNWYVDQGRLNVVFKSNPAVPMQFDLKNLDPFYAGANFDVVFVIDAIAPTDLGNAYRQDPGMFAELPVINISNKQNNTRFGRVNIVDPNVASNSELVFQLLQILRAPVGGDVGSLLLLGIQDATNKLQNKGPQTEGIVNQLYGMVSQQIDLDSVRSQATNQPLPLFANPPAMPGYAYQGGQMPQYGQPTQYPPQNPYQQQQYPQQTQYGYSPNPAQGGYMPQQQYPSQAYQGYMPQQPAYQPAQMVQPGNFIEEVPSIQHDASQYQSYIPTSEAMGYEHVDPSLATPATVQGVPNYEEYAESIPEETQEESPQPANPNVAATVGEAKLDKNEKDQFAAPKIFGGGGGGERGRG